VLFAVEFEASERYFNKCPRRGKDLAQGPVEGVLAAVPWSGRMQENQQKQGFFVRCEELFEMEITRS
jgi:hypothetical protein